jgi:glycosyltransferase involved in cell wall biosynthesis
MATFNGESFINVQLESIIAQLKNKDEFIIVDDCSTDMTVNIIETYKDKRVTLYRNSKNEGHVSTFAKAIGLSKREIVVLADQDDIWMSNRLNLIRKSLTKSKKLVLTSNYTFFDNFNPRKTIKPIYRKASDSDKYLKNILSVFYGSSGYVGCAMAFHKDLKKIILPIPLYVESHDLWIAIAGNLLKSNIHIENITLLRRIHLKNASLIKRPVFKKIYSRFVHLLSVLILIIRIKTIPEYSKKHY